MLTYCSHLNALTLLKTLARTCLSRMGTYLALCGIMVGAKASSMVSFLAVRPCLPSHCLTVNSWSLIKLQAQKQVHEMIIEHLHTKYNQMYHDVSISEMKWSPYFNIVNIYLSFITLNFCSYINRYLFMSHSIHVNHRP